MTPDKQKHFLVGVCIALIVGVAFSALVGAIVAAIAGVGKEVYDHWQNVQAEKAGLLPPHSVDFLDFVYTALGGAVGAALVVAVLPY